MSINTAPIAVDEAIQQLVQSYNNEAIQHDDMVFTIEKLQTKNDELQDLLVSYEKSANKLVEKMKTSEQLIQQANLERDQALNKAKDSSIILASFKEIAASPKKIREKIKGYQDRLTTQKTAAESNKKKWLDERSTSSKLNEQIKDLTNRLDASSINQVYRNGLDIVSTFPYQLGDAIHGYQANQMPLLYMNATGRGGLILLNEDGEPQLADAPKNGLRPKKETMEHCGQILRRFQSKNWQLEASDLESISHNSQ